VHCIVDNLSGHFTSTVEKFLDQRPHILHNTPTHASWLNQVELSSPSSNAACFATASSNSSATCRPRHRVHRGVKPSIPTVPQDLRRPLAQGRVTHNHFTARALAGGGRPPSRPPPDAAGVAGRPVGPAEPPLVRQRVRVEGVPAQSFCARPDQLLSGPS
jgi:hypothetical protein